MVRLNCRLGRNVIWSILLFAIISCTLFSGTAFCEEAAEDVLAQAKQDYAQARALHELKKYEEGGVKISDIVNDFAFWHIGQSAADYRRLFDELPSETLKKC